MVGFERVAYFLADQTSAVNVLGGDTVRRLAEKRTELTIRVVGVGRVLALAKVANTNVLGVTLPRLS